MFCTKFVAPQQAREHGATDTMATRFIIFIVCNGVPTTNIEVCVGNNAVQTNVAASSTLRA